MKATATVVATAGPVLLDLWGVHVPALSLLMGLAAVICVRIMLIAKEYRRDIAFWYYHISLTILMAFITFAVIADNQLAPGVAVMVGTGIGASGMVIVDILKDRIQRIIKAAIGDHKDEDS